MFEEAGAENEARAEAEAYSENGRTGKDTKAASWVI